MASAVKCARRDRFFEEHKPDATLGKRSVQGALVGMLAKGINAVVQVGCIFFLARLLTPDDYGVVAMVTAITGFAPVFVDLGTRDAIVQRDRLAPSEVSALFWLTLSLGLVFAVIVGACGPLIAAFYKEPRLVNIALLSSLTFLTVALTCQHQALMRRMLMFRHLGLLEVGANVGGALVALGMAFKGSGYWALVVRPIVTNTLLAAGVWWCCPWRPGKPEFSRGVSEMVKFGFHLTGFTMTDFAGRSLDRVTIGYANGPASLGLYQNALLVYDNILELLTNPLHGVAVASLSKLRSNSEALKRSWSIALSALAFVSMPLFGLLALGGKELIVLALGTKWEYAGALFTVLAFRGIAQTIERTLGWLHVASGCTERWMRWGVFSTLLQLVALACGLPFGPMGIVIAFTLHSFVLFIPAITYAGKPLGIRSSDVIRAVGPQLIGTLAAWAAAHYLQTAWLSTEPVFLEWVILCMVYLAVYLLIVSGLFKVRKPLGLMLSLVSGALPARARNLGRSHNTK